MLSATPVAGISPSSSEHSCSGLRLCYAICGEKAEWCDAVGGLNGWLSNDLCSISECPCVDNFSDSDNETEVAAEHAMVCVQNELVFVDLLIY